MKRRRRAASRSDRGRLPAAHLAAPGAVLDAAQLEQLLEPLEVAADATAVDAGHRADLLERALRPVGHPEPDPRLALAELVEPDGAAGLAAVEALPHDLRVGHLLEDLRLPLGLPTADRGGPPEAGVVELLDVVDALH